MKASRIFNPKIVCPPERTPVSSPVQGCPACNREKGRIFEWQCCRMVSCGRCSSIRGVRTANSKSKVYNPPERCPHCGRANPEIVQATESSLIPTVLRELDGLSGKRVTSSHIIDIQEPSVERVPAKSNMSKKKRHRETKKQPQGPKPKKMRTESNSGPQTCEDSNVPPPRGHWNYLRTQNCPVQSGYRDEDSWCRHCHTVGHVIYNCPVDPPQRSTDSGNRGGWKGRVNSRIHSGGREADHRNGNGNRYISGYYRH